MVSNAHEYDVRLVLVQLMYEALAAGILGTTSDIFTKDFEAEMLPFDSNMPWNGLFEGPKEFIEKSLTPFWHSIDRTNITYQAYVSRCGLVHVLIKARLLESGSRIVCHQQWTVEGNKLAHLHSLCVGPSSSIHD